MNNDIDSNFQRSFNQSGNELELYITNELSLNFQIQNQPTFLDLDEGKSRDGDILANEKFPAKYEINSKNQNKHMTAQLVLTIECKCLPDHAWIFTEGEISQCCWYFSLIRDKDDFHEFLCPKTTLNELRGAKTFLETIADWKDKNQLR